MTQLTEVQRKLAEQLLLSVKNKEMNVEYNELAQRISPPIHWRQVGKNIGEIPAIGRRRSMRSLTQAFIVRLTATIRHFSAGIPANHILSRIT